MKKIYCLILLFMFVLEFDQVAAETDIKPLDTPKGIITLTPKPAPKLILKDMDEVSFDLKKSRGHWVFVHFWASWCVPCRREMPTIDKAMKVLANSSLEFVIINTAETEDTVFNFLGIVAPDINPLLDSDGQVTELWEPRGLPSTYLVDAQGQQRYLALGGRPWDEKEYIDFLSRLGAQR